MPFRLLKKILSPSSRKFHDAFIARIRVAVPGEGMMTEGNIFAFDHALKNLPQTGAILEIGSWAGMSTMIIAALMRKHGHAERPFFTCDPWIYEGFDDQLRQHDAVYMQHVDGSDTLLRTDYMQFVHEQFVRNARFFCAERLPHSFRLTSDIFFENWQKNAQLEDVFKQKTTLGGPLAFVYVDGDHALETARRDVENALKCLVPGGFLLLDDSAAGQNFGSAQLGKMLRADTRLELVSQKPNCFFRIPNIPIS